MNTPPAGVTTAQVRAGTYRDFAFAPAKTVTVKITPELGGTAKQITHAETGDVLGVSTLTYAKDDTGYVIMTLPHTDQPGWIDAEQRPVAGWVYKAEISYTLPGGSVNKTVRFSLPVGQTEIDLDRVATPEITGPVTAPAAYVTSVNGRTGAVVLDDLGGAAYDDSPLKARVTALEAKPAYDDQQLRAAISELQARETVEPYNDGPLSARVTTLETAPAPTWDTLTGRPTTFAPAAHSHPQTEVTGLVAALASKADTAHTHPWTAITSRPTTFPPSAHAHPLTDVTGLDTALAGKAAAAHTHPFADVPGLQAALDSKAAAGAGGATYDDTALKARVTTLETKPAPTWGDLTGKPTTFAPAAHTHPIGDVTDLTAALAGKAAAAHAHAWPDITGKPATFAPSAHAHPLTDVTGLDTALAGKSDSSHVHAWTTITGRPTTFAPAAHTHPQADVTNLVTDLAGKAPATHTHDDRYFTETEVTTALAGKAATTHTHPQSEVTNLVTDLAGKAAAAHTHPQADVTGLVTALAGKAAAAHTHDDRYFTEAEVTALLANRPEVLILGPSDAIPAGTPAGTLIGRTA